MAVTDFNDNTKKEIQDFIENEGITSFKNIHGYKGALMIDDRQMVGLMEEVKNMEDWLMHATNEWRHDRLPGSETPGRRESLPFVSLPHSRK